MNKQEKQFECKPKQKIKKEKKEIICLRCGISEKEVKREKSSGCNAWGSYYHRHLYK